jgi:pseudo-rSAM protein
MKNLNEISFYINVKGSLNGCYINGFNQSVYRDCVNNVDLRFSAIKIFLEQIGGSSVSLINIYADNILKYAELGHLANELDKMHIIKTFYLPLRSFPANIDELKFLGSPQFRLKILVDPDFDSRVLDEIFQKLRTSGIQCEWSFFVSSKQEFKKVNSVISKTDFGNTDIKPFLNGKNIRFFQDNIYLTKEDLLNSNLSKREIFAHQVLNTNDFGKLTVLPDRKVYANVNHPPLGLINEPVNKMVFNEMDKGTSWRKIRDMKPCSDCVYQWLCPSPSNYELAIGKPNLCHIK